MKKINNKSINYGLKILTILAFALVFVPFHNAKAQEVLYGYGTNYPNVNGNSGYAYSSNTNSYYNTTPYQAPIYVAPAPAASPIVYSSATNPNANDGSNVMTVTYTPTAAAPVATTKTNTAKTVASTTTSSNSANNNGNSLAANAVYGSNSFLPSGLIQWILFAIFILLLVILTRKIFGAENNYQSIPLKHE